MKCPNFSHSQSLLIMKLPQASYPHPSEGRQNENHNHRKPTKLITWIQPCLIQWNYEPCYVWPPKMEESWWRILTKWSNGEGNGKLLQHSCLENPMNSMKRQKDMTLKDELPRLVGAQYATGEEWRNNSRKNEETEPKQKQRLVVNVTGDRNKVWCCKEQYCLESWNVRSMNQGKLEAVK